MLKVCEQHYNKETKDNQTDLIDHQISFDLYRANNPCGSIFLAPNGVKLLI